MRRNHKKGFVALDGIITGAIALTLLAAFMPNLRTTIGLFGTRTDENIKSYEHKTGELVATNPSGASGLNPSNYVIDNTILADKVVLTQDLYFNDPYPKVNTDEMIVLTVLSNPSNITNNKVDWSILAGSQLAYIIKSVDTRSVEITGVSPGRIVLQAKTQDTSGRIAYAYVDVIRQPSSISLDQTKVNLKVSDPSNNSKTITATVLPADTTENYVVWSYENPTGSECTSFTTNGHSITVTAKKPEGISCNNVVAKFKATTSDPNIYTILEVVVNE